MSKHQVEIGSRIGAIRDEADRVVSFFGYGIFTGRTIPPKNVGGFNLGVPNPTLLLDSGIIVYGCECWWGDEDAIKKSLKGKVINIVEPTRKSSKKETNQ